MKRELLYNRIEKTLCVCYPLNDEHGKTLIKIFLNEGCAEFENRDVSVLENTDGQDMSWTICDELVEMGLLEEDEESYTVFYEITEDGNEIVKQLTDK